MPDQPVARVLALLAALLVGVIGANLATPDAKAEAPAEYTVTRPLYGGWNLLSWVGDDADVSDFKRSIPEIVEVLRASSRWPDVDEVSLSAADRLRSGDLLWVRLDLPLGESADWTIDADLAERDVPLRRGLNVIGWPGRDMIRGEDLVGAATDAPQAITVWDGASQNWRLAVPRELSPRSIEERAFAPAMRSWRGPPSRRPGCDRLVSPRHRFSATASTRRSEERRPRALRQPRRCLQVPSAFTRRNSRYWLRARGRSWRCSQGTTGMQTGAKAAAPDHSGTSS